MQLLIVDDQQQILDVLGDFVTDCGHEVVTATNGAEALAKLEDTAHVGAVLSDIRMPKMDGIDFLKGVRVRFPGIPVVLMTGHGDETIATTALQEGAFDYLKKPVRLTDLLSCIARIEERSKLEESVVADYQQITQHESRSAGVDEPGPAVEEAQLTGRFLVVDVDGPSRRALYLWLVDQGHQVDLAEGGKEAEERVRHTVYDSVLSELQLFDTDGTDLIQRLTAADPSMIAVAVTAATDRDTILQAMHAGARGLLTKPLSDVAIAEQIRITLRERKRVVDSRLFLGDLIKVRSDLRLEVVARERYLSNLIDSAPFGIVSTDTGGSIVTFNSKAEQMYGYKEAELLGRQLSVLCADGAEMVVPPMEGRSVKADHSRKDRTRLPVLVYGRNVFDGNGKHVARLHVFEDQTAREQMEAQLLQAERLSVLGQLAPRVAHEFKTPMQAILGNAELIGLDLDEGKLDRVRENAAEIVAAVEQMQFLVKQMLNLGKPVESKDQELDIGEETNRILDLLNPLKVLQQCQVITDFESDLPLINGDAAQIEQALRNLLVNASHAVEGETERKITLSAKADETRTKVIYTMEDSGCGIPPELKTRCSSRSSRRNLTAKAPDWVCRSSRPSSTGTVSPCGWIHRWAKALASHSPFRLCVKHNPKAKAMSENRQETNMVASTESKPNLLLVDDDAALRRVFSHMLQRSGYAVVSAEDGEAALKEAWAKKFDLVLTDIHMPGMTGDQLIGQLREIQPEMMSVIMTAKPDMNLAIKAVNQGVQQFLTKPLQLDDLQKCLSTIFDSRNEEIRKIQRQFATTLLEEQESLGDDFDLQKAAKAVIGLDSELDDDSAETDSNRQPHVLLLCEPIPENLENLKKSKRYRHFRTIYLAQKILNDQLRNRERPAEVRLAMINGPAEYGKALQQYGDQIRCVIFGPSFENVTDSAVRLAASTNDNRRVVVCHNPSKADFSWERLQKLGVDLGVEGYRATADEGQIVSFWADFFTNQLKPMLGDSTGTHPAPQNCNRTDPVQAALERDSTALELLPAYPHVCKQVLRVIDEGASYEKIGDTIRLDGALHASIIHTANLARYGNQQRVERVATALSVIGTQETRKIIVGRAMGDLIKRVQQSGFNNRDFFMHSCGTAYLAQLLSLNLESPSVEEKSILHGLRLPSHVTAILSHFRIWERFALKPGFDPFGAGILHDVGKITNTVCFPDAYALILNEIERREWKSPLVDCEAAIVGDMQHAQVGAAILKRWEVFPDLATAIRDHHHMAESSSAETALIALSNCLVKGIYPFPTRIDLSTEARQETLGLNGETQRGRLDNPVPGAYKALHGKFDKKRAKLDMSKEEMESGTRKVCPPENRRY